MTILYLSLLLSTTLVWCQSPSPCPNILTYERMNSMERNKRYGVLHLKSPEDLIGIWLHITLDRKAEVLGNWFGVATSTDNKAFIIRNTDYELKANDPITIRFFIKYDTRQPVPNVKTIRLNGKTICDSKEIVRQEKSPMDIFEQPLLCTLSHNASLLKLSSEIPLLCKISEA